MREIKFRAWDNKVGHMFEDVGFDNTSKSDDRMTYLQYTGLLDKNGKEIFEGDIVKTEWRYLPEALTVKFGEYQTEEEHSLCWFGENRGITLALSIATPCEVIGNIYENKELLK